MTTAVNNNENQRKADIILGRNDLKVLNEFAMETARSVKTGDLDYDEIQQALTLLALKRFLESLGYDRNVFELSNELVK